MAPQEAKNGPKKGRRGCKNDPKPQVEPRSAPRRPQDRPGTRPRVDFLSSAAPREPIWASQNDPKRSLKQFKIQAKIENRKKAIQEHQGPVLERSWSLWGRHVGARRPRKYWKPYYFVQIHFFADKTVRRGFRQPLKRKKAPRGAKITPRGDPRSTPKRPQIDIEIVIEFDAKTKRAGQGLTFTHWVEPPPWEAPQGLRGGGPSDTGPAPRHPCAR